MIELGDYMKFSMPVAVDQDGATIIMGEVIWRKSMIPYLAEILRRNSKEAKRRIAERPYSGRDNASQSKMDEMLSRTLQEDAMLMAAKHGESVVSMSPVRLSPFGFMPGAGTAYIEYTTVPLTPWED